MEPAEEVEVRIMEPAEEVEVRTTEPAEEVEVQTTEPVEEQPEMEPEHPTVRQQEAQMHRPQMIVRQKYRKHR